MRKHGRPLRGSNELETAVRKEMVRQKIEIADLSHDWGATRGGICRQAGEAPPDHLSRLGRELGSAQKITRYAAAIARGAALPPVLAVRWGRTLALVDGCHTTAATALLGRPTIDAVVFHAASEQEASEFAEAFWESENQDKMPANLQSLPLAA